MERYHKIRRMGICLILWAVILRFSDREALQSLADYLSRPEQLALLIYLQTGKDTRSCFLQSETEELSPRVSETLPMETMPTQPQPPETLPPETLPSETLPKKAKAPEISLPGWQALEIAVNCKVSPDIRSLYEKPLPWKGRPKILLYSTHSTESYTPGTEPYTPSADYRTLDTGQNVLSVGAFLAQRLRQLGLEVIVDGSIHDSPSYNGAYSHARKGITKLLQENPDVDLVLDLHRDAVQTKSGQLRTAVAGKDDCARIMLVVGTNASGTKHPDWQENLGVALKLEGYLQAIQPGITRPLNLRAQRFNQDLSKGAVLVEIGAAGNTRQEALKATEILAQAVARLVG